MHIKTAILSFLLIIFGSMMTARATNVYLSFRNDTSIEKNTKSDSIIDAIIHSQNVPTEQTSELIGKFTKYGFRNLFKEYSYNPDQPYANQINPNAEVYMSDFLKLHRQELHKLKNYAVPYFNLIENIFKQYHLPTELKYLAVIESGLKKSATSWVGAAGPWQFMPKTAKIFGLQVNKQNDERRDYFKSTHAAARFLLQLYKNLNDWLLVIAAYNSGPERVFDAIKKSGSRDFWILQYYLPLESRNHVKKFIATHYTMENNDNVPFKNNNVIEHDKINNTSESINISSILISGKYNARAICSFINMTEKEFDEYNPRFNEILTHKGSYDMSLPNDKMGLFKQKKYDILNECVRLLLE